MILWEAEFETMDEYFSQANRFEGGKMLLHNST